MVICGCIFPGVEFSLITHLLLRVEAEWFYLAACFLGFVLWVTCYRVVCRPYVEYKGTVPQNELQSKQNELQAEANSLITKGGKVCTFKSKPSLFIYLEWCCVFTTICPRFIQVSVSILPYDEASQLCGGSLPEYIPKVSILFVSPICNLHSRLERECLPNR